MITAFGKALRGIRLDHDEVLKDMAEKLRVSSSFLSAVETGRKNVPVGWPEQITRLYGLSSNQQVQLEELAKNAITSVKIDLFRSTNNQRKAALVFARDFDSLSDETATRIIELLKNEEGD